jgi:hypothetical protein
MNIKRMEKVRIRVTYAVMNYENLETATEMRELVITLMKKGNRDAVKLDNSVEEMNFSSETSVKLSPCNFSGI